MKLHHIYILFLLLTSCGKELPLFTEEKTYTLEEININNVTVIKISGIINDSLRLSFGKHYLLSGKCVIGANGILSIEDGVKVYAEKDAVLIIERKGKLSAIGKKDSPIEFTSVNELYGGALPGDWVGIHINGQANINGRSTPLVIEIGKYGRQEDELDDDDSGELRYVKVKYAGQLMGGSSGAINFNGCGSNTKVDFVQAFYSKGFGIRIRGGKVNLFHCIATQTEGTGISWDNGWTGLGQYWIIHQTQLISSDTISMMLGKSSTENNAPRSNPTISNITIVGLDNQQSRGLRLNDATWASMYNMIVTRTNRGLRVDYLEDAILNDDLKIRNSRIFGNEIDFYNSESSKAGLFDKAFMGNNSNPVNLQGFIGSSNDNAFNPNSLDKRFEEAIFIGAVKDQASNWTNNWISL